MVARTMSTDKRKAKRRRLRRSAWVALGPDDLQACTLSDVSDAGARLEVDETVSIPDHFILFLSSNGAARRSCEVVWRQARQVGVKFGNRLASTTPATPRSEPSEPASQQDNLAFQNREDVIAQTNAVAVASVGPVDGVKEQ
jgi:hypothetical protein